MLASFVQRLDQNARRLLPLASTLLFVLIGIVPWPVPYAGNIVPSFGLVAVYYWSIHRPDLFHPVTAFFTGLLHDALHFLPLGITAIVFVAVHQIVLRQRRFFVGQTFFMLWAGFAFVMFLIVAFQILALSAYYGRWVALMPIVLQGGLTVVLFPFPAWLLIKLHRFVSKQG